MFVANRNALGNVYYTSQGDIHINGANRSFNPEQNYGVTQVDDKVWEEITKKYAHSADFIFNQIFAQSTEKSLHAKAAEYINDHLRDAPLVFVETK